MLRIIAIFEEKKMRNLLLASTSTLHGENYLDYLLPTLKTFFKDVTTLIFIPYARPSGISHDEYTQKVRVAFSKINIQVKGLHEFENTKNAIAHAEAIFTGGGNTFLLVSQLYKLDIIDTLEQVLKRGTPYLGASAGTNICGLTMGTTNDMPIVQPKSFQTLGLIPFNINAHYLDPLPDFPHMGETRTTRINEFHQFNTQPVLGLREGSWLAVTDTEIILKGSEKAKWFQANKEAVELEIGTDIKRLL